MAILKLNLYINNIVSCEQAATTFTLNRLHQECYFTTHCQGNSLLVTVTALKILRLVMKFCTLHTSDMTEIMTVSQSTSFSSFPALWSCIHYTPYKECNKTQTSPQFVDSTVFFKRIIVTNFVLYFI